MQSGQSFGAAAEDLPGSPSRAPAGDNLLPPVEPPSAGFIIQLFVIPALIVLVIVAVWLMFNWLVRQAARPQDLIQGLESGPSIARWQRANELANMLRDERHDDFKRSSAAAKQLAGILEREIDQAGAGGGMDEREVALRAFLARALGEFEVNDGIDVLLKAAGTNRDPAERLMRYYAIDAIAVRAFNLHNLNPPQALVHPELETTLFRLAGDEDPLIRRRAAYALDKIGTPAAIERLEVMADDPDADTRYNAAVGLAHHGNARAVETLAEMLELEPLDSVADEAEQDRAFKRAVIVSSALQAVEALAQQNSMADLSLVAVALERLAAADPPTLAKAYIPSRAASEARRVMNSLPGHAESPRG